MVSAQVAPDVLLAIRGLETQFDGRSVHRNLDLDVHRGELLVLFGGSGSGKSTLLRSVIGLERPVRGDITLEGQSLLVPEGILDLESRKRIGFSFQSGALFDSLTVAENLEYPLRDLMNLSEAKRREAASAMLVRVGLPGIERLYPAELSGGMQKRVGLARALMLDPLLLLYDEPTAGLDPANTRKITEFMRELKHCGKTAILVTHDVPCALAVADRIAFLDGGKISALQSIADLKKTPDALIAAYIQGEVA
jgi:phospholipid/cholesterol/gamma-HCH transport system ATP-binding protein